MPSQLTRAEADALVDLFFTDPLNKQITAERARILFHHFIASAYWKADDNINAGPGQTYVLPGPNLRRDGVSITTVISPASMGYNPGELTRDTLNPAFLCLGHRNYSEFNELPDPFRRGLGQVDKLVYDAAPRTPGTGLYVFKSGAFMGNTLPAKWVPVDSPEAGVPAYDYLQVDAPPGGYAFAVDELIRDYAGGATELFFKAITAGTHPAPTDADGDANWEPVGREQIPAPTVNVRWLTVAQMQTADVQGPDFTYVLIDAGADNGYLVIKGLPTTTVGATEYTSALAPEGFYQDPATGLWSRVAYDLVNDEVTIPSPDITPFVPLVAPITQRDFDGTISGETDFSAAGAWNGDDRSIFLNQNLYELTSDAVLGHGVVLGNGAAVQSPTYALTFDGGPVQNLNVRCPLLVNVDTPWYGGSLANTIQFIGAAALVLRDVDASVVSAVTVDSGVSGCTIILQNSTRWNDSLTLPAGVTLVDLRPVLPQDRYIDPSTTPATTVIAGTFTNGELQGTQPAGSLPGQKFTTTTHGYEYQKGAAGSLVWCRFPKS